MSLLSDVFSIRRSEASPTNPAGKASADKERRSRRMSLSAKYQSLFSNFSHEIRAAHDSNLKSNQPVDSTTRSYVPYGETTLLKALTPVTIIEPRESPKSVEETESPGKPRLRRRPKTPIRRIGEIEGYSEQFINQRSVALAKEYQATCELRPNTASPPASPTYSIRSLRKVGRHYDLRRTSIDSDSPRSANLSDEETVVGSEGRPRRLRNDSNTSFSSYGSSRSSRSTTSYYSAASGEDEPKNPVLTRGTPNWSHETPTKPLNFATRSVNHNVEMQICLDLLKQDLSSAMSPQEPSDSTFALQLWLMIESYEAMKQRLQQQQLQDPAGLGSKKTSESTFQVLDHWLEALYSVYNLQVNGQCGKVTGMNQASTA